jgi:hypothetical protein
MPRRIRETNRDQISYLNNQPLPPFASTPEEIRTAVEKSAISRGVLLIKVIVRMDIENILSVIKNIADDYDKEEIIERCTDLEIKTEALARLENVNPPVSYPYYFCTPEMLVEHPALVIYYRNLAMLSRKVMTGLGMNTGNYENGIAPSLEVAQRLSKYFNKIISEFVIISGVTPLRHLEIVLSNIGDGLGGVSRNEVGRMASTQIMRYLLTDLHSIRQVHSIRFSLKGNLDNLEEGEEEQQQEDTGELLFTDDMNLPDVLENLERNRVKYKEMTLRNGYSLLLDRQLVWRDNQGGEHKIGADLHSRTDAIDMIWAGEIKGGADPAGSDEHWKTATKALQRIIDAARDTGRNQPQLSFLATILVDRVAVDAQQWINEGKLTSVYNLTQISENADTLRAFLDDMRRFLGVV